jgi:hypothetical protein
LTTPSSCLAFGSEFVKGLGDLGEGVGDGLVPVHVRAVCAQFPRALFIQGCLRRRADGSGGVRRRDRVGVGGAVDDRGGSGLGFGERVRDYVEDDGHPEAVAAPLQAADGTAAEFERAGPVVREGRYRGSPDQVDRTAVAERRAELAAFAQAGPGPAGVGDGDGHTHGEQAGCDQGRGADLAGERECLAGQRERPVHVIDEYIIGYGDGELDGGVGEVAAGPGDAGGLFGQAGGVGERAAGVGDVLPGGADELLYPPLRGVQAGVGVGSAAAEFFGAGTVRADGGEQGADREGERVTRVVGGAGQFQGRGAGE